MNANMHLPKLILSDNSIELLKWLALIMMVIDHVNKYLFNGTINILFDIGRLVMPIFIVILAFNLARPGQLKNNSHKRIMARLLVFGILATIPYFYLSGKALPLNILFTLLSITAIIYFIERENIIIAVAIFVSTGMIVEYWWPALLLGVSIWSYIKKPNIIAAFVAITSYLSLYFINENMWAIASIPLILLIKKSKIPIPKYKWVFYVFYPFHLGVLWLIRIPMSHAGYLFF